MTPESRNSDCSHRADVAVIGGGIVGLAFAWEAAKCGLRVVLFERDSRAQGASIRNFGMIWPIGQPQGIWYECALRSRDRWLELKDHAKIWVAECGSLHLAHADDELAILQEFLTQSQQHDLPFQLLSPAETIRRFPAVNPERLQGAMYSPVEACVDPRQAIAMISNYLAEQYRVNIRYNTSISTVEMPYLRTACGEVWQVERCIVCGGAEFATLYPKVWAESGMRRCKLQMMRSAPQPNNWRLGTHIAGGLTLGHYRAFESCPTLTSFKSRIATELPDYVRYGIHVMASQNHLGEIVIGDSHEYDGSVTPFDKAIIDNFILSYLRTLVHLPDWSIESRWHGIYIKHPTETVFESQPQPNCHIIGSPGGAGMTLSFGFAERWWKNHISQ